MQFYTKLPMPKLLFLSRVAFICNICYILSFLFRIFSYQSSQDISATIIILGNVFSIVLNFIVSGWYALKMATSHPLHQYPGWLIIFNFLFLWVQLWAVSCEL